MLMRTVLFCALLVACLFAVSGTPLTAQGARRVQVALVDSLSVPTARAEVLRFAEPGRADLILLRSGSATPEDLVAAIAQLRASAGRRPSRPGTVAITTIVGVGEAVPAADGLRLRAAKMLAEVRRSPVARIGNLGRGKWSEFDVGQ